VPTPSLPRSFVVRRVDLEVTPPSRGSIFGLRPKLAYTYLRGATAVVAVAFALLVAGEQIAQFSLGARQPELALAPPAGERQQEAAVETVLLEAAPADAVEGAPSATVEVEKEVERAAPSASLPPSEKQEESIRALEVSKEPTEEAAAVEAPPATESVVVEETCGDGDTPTPAPQPTSVPETAALRPTPPPSPSPVPVATEAVEAREGPSLVRVAEIGLGGLALLLLTLTLIVRRQQF
jgi:hypothetical protein